MESSLMLLTSVPSWSSIFISRIPSKMELNALAKYSFDNGDVNVKIAIASASFKRKERSFTNFNTASSPNSVRRCVSESTTTLIPLLLVGEEPRSSSSSLPILLLRSGLSAANLLTRVMAVPISDNVKDNLFVLSLFSNSLIELLLSEKEDRSLEKEEYPCLSGEAL